MRFLSSPSFLFTLATIAVTTITAAASAQSDTTPSADPFAGNFRGQAVMLRYDMPTEWNRHTPNATIREFIRQAILIAARDGLSLPTRDITLREQIPDEQFPLDIDIHYIWKQPWIITVTRKDNPHGKETWKDTITVENPGSITLLVEAVEARSRNQWITELRKMGFQGQPVKTNSDATVPLQAMQQLDEMNFISQFAAVRQIHETIASQGQSPDLLAALVRGYANLGQLTRPIMNGTCKAFRARAILYAQRLMQLDDHSQFAHSHLAYAWFMAGWHARAISEIDRIKEFDADRARQNGEQPNYQPTLLEQIITLYVNYDTKGLQNLVDRTSRYRALTDFLAFLTIKYRAGKTLLLETGNHVLYTTTPTCYRILDELNVAGGISSLHRTTLQGSEMLNTMLDVNLAMIDTLPQQVLPTLEINGNNLRSAHLKTKRVVKALVEAGDIHSDRSPASWQILARMIEETNYRIVWWRTYFMARKWSVDVNPYLKQVGSSIESHPYAPLIYMYRLDRQQQRDQYYSSVKDVVIRDASINMYPMLQFGWYFGEEQYNPCVKQWHQLFLFKDWVADDLLAGIKYHGNDQAVIDYAQSLNKVSPDCPYAIATLVNRDTDNQRQNFEQYRRKHAKNPLVMRALAHVYMKDESWPRAVQCLEKSLTVEADRWTYENLAKVYLEQGNEQQWKQTLDAYLHNITDFGLDHSNVRVNMARHYMERGDFHTAMPYARKAAQSGSYRSMACAAKCAEALADYRTAEDWMQAIAERYDSSQIRWYFWCVRTGQGNLQDASTLAEKYLKRNMHNPDRATLIKKGVYSILNDDFDSAYEAFKEAHNKLPRPYTAIHLYLLALERNDEDIMIAALNATRQHVQQGTQWPIHRVQLQFLELLNQHHQMGGEFKFQLADQFINCDDEDNRQQLSYFTARYLDLISLEQHAAKYYKQSAASSSIDEYECMLANHTLRKHNIEPPTWYKQIAPNEKPTSEKSKAPPAPL